MKFQKLFLSSATGCLLLGALGTAMAQTVDCAGGTIIGQDVDEIVINGQSCVIYRTRVTGKVEITNSPILEMTFTDVGGPVTITGPGASAAEVNQSTVANVDVLQGDLTVTGNKLAVVGGCDLENGNLTVNDNGAAFVSRNDVKGTPSETGNITCTGNAELDAVSNRASGTINCTPN